MCTYLLILQFTEIYWMNTFNYLIFRRENFQNKGKPTKRKNSVLIGKEKEIDQSMVMYSVS